MFKYVFWFLLFFNGGFLTGGGGGGGQLPPLAPPLATAMVSYEKPSSSYCVMLYFWWGCRRTLTLITLGSERVKLDLLPNQVMTCRWPFRASTDTLLTVEAICSRRLDPPQILYCIFLNLPCLILQRVYGIFIITLDSVTGSWLIGLHLNKDDLRPDVLSWGPSSSKPD